MSDNRYSRGRPRIGDGTMVLTCSKCGEPFYVEPCDITTFPNETTVEPPWMHRFNKATPLCNECKDIFPDMVVEIDMGPGAVQKFDP
jgi:hypothetical protein